MSKSSEKELPLDIPDRWTVEPVFRHQTKADIELKLSKELKFYALMYGGIIQKKATGERHVERLREMAKFCNARKLAPRPSVQCLADTNVPPLPRKAKRHNETSGATEPKR